MAGCQFRFPPEARCPHPLSSSPDTFRETSPGHFRRAYRAHIGKGPPLFGTSIDCAPATRGRGKSGRAGALTPAALAFPWFESPAAWCLGIRFRRTSTRGLQSWPLMPQVVPGAGPRSSAGEDETGTCGHLAVVVSASIQIRPSLSSGSPFDGLEVGRRWAAAACICASSHPLGCPAKLRDNLGCGLASVDPTDRLTRPERHGFDGAIGCVVRHAGRVLDDRDRSTA
ncbi:hypothetical protein SAMN02927895_00869 [Belnapia rosea]|nr:hypothetical protein SAMN02927895_00869 [Belnapia rosea]